MRRSFTRVLFARGVGACAVCLFAAGAQASGFALIEQSAGQMGQAFAGGAAIADDASTVFFNPAGLTRVPHQFIAGAHLVDTQAKFQGTAHALDGVTPTTGGNGNDAGGPSMVPNLYYALPLNPTTFFGLGVNAPFGLSTAYNDTWKGRYLAVDSYVATLNINPSLAFKVNDAWSVGVGLNAQYIEAKLTQQVDYGSICVAAVGLGTCSFLGLLPQQADGLAKVRGNDWSMGFNAGVLFNASEDTRIGFAYRSEVQHDLKGRGYFNNAPAAIVSASGGRFTTSDIEASLHLPQTASLSIYHDLNDRLALMADATWTGWSSFHRLRIKYDNPAQPDTTVDENWNDSMRYSIGANYRSSANLLLRAGLAFDATPIPNRTHRTPRIPGEDRVWTSLGFNYAFNPSVSLDVGYAHLFVKNPKLNYTDENGLNITGSYDAAVDIVSAQLNWNI